MNYTGINMGAVKQNNRSSILKYLIKQGPVSRKEIAEATGLTPASVTQLTNEFIGEKILRELGVSEETGRAGRKKILIDINYDLEYLFAVSIEVDEVTIALTNLRGGLLDKEKLLLLEGEKPQDLLQRIADVCKLIKEHQKPSKQKKIKAIAVTVPGIVDSEGKVAVHAYGIWEEEVAVADYFERELGLDCLVENNVNSFAYATILYGEGTNYDHLNLIKWGPGVGSSLIIDNKIYEGRHGRAGELGHFIVEKDGRKCSCGRHGCLETKVSYQALNRVRHFKPYGFESCYQKAGDRQKEIFDEAMDLFARSVVNSMTILATNRVVLCGFLFEDEKTRKRFIRMCKTYDKKINEKLILYTCLSEVEDYIGPVAFYYSKKYIEG